MARRPKTLKAPGERYSVYLYPEEHLWLLETYGGVTAGIRAMMEKEQAERKDSDELRGPSPQLPTATEPHKNRERF